MIMTMTMTKTITITITIKNNNNNYNNNNNNKLYYMNNAIYYLLYLCYLFLIYSKNSFTRSILKKTSKNCTIKNFFIVQAFLLSNKFIK